MLSQSITSLRARFISTTRELLAGLRLTPLPGNHYTDKLDRLMCNILDREMKRTGETDIDTIVAEFLASDQEHFFQTFINLCKVAPELEEPTKKALKIKKDYLELIMFRLKGKTSDPQEQTIALIVSDLEEFLEERKAAVKADFQPSDRSL